MRLLKNYPDAVFKTQVNTYYDTDELAIRKAKGAMRIRTIDDRFLFTLKRHTDSGVAEYEKFVMANDLSVFDDEEIKTLLDSIPITGSLKKITVLTTDRAMIFLDHAELCFDVNHYGDRVDYEIEYEYKQPHDGRTVFNEILACADLVYTKNCASKIKRAFDAHFVSLNHKEF